jgi:hypothetical protein
VSLGGAAHQEMVGDTSTPPKVLMVVQSQGSQVVNDKVVVEYKSQMHVLNSQDPPLANPFSQNFVKKMHECSAGTAWPAEAFWRNLEDDTMQDFF